MAVLCCDHFLFHNSLVQCLFFEQVRTEEKFVTLFDGL